MLKLIENKIKNFSNNEMMILIYIITSFAFSFLALVLILIFEK